MSTFNELVSVMRREIISETAGDGGFDDAADLLPMLYNASAEVAAHLAFPVVLNASVSWEAEDYSFSPPADMVWPRALFVNMKKVELRPTDWVVRKLGLPAERTPRFFSFDPRHASGDVLFAPASLSGQAPGSATLEYVSGVDVGALSGASEVWGGLFPDFHWVVPLRAGANAWNSVGEFERSEYFNEKFNQGLQVFAARLGVTNVANLMLPREARDDKGGRLG